jgi:hypothetical protein
LVRYVQAVFVYRYVFGSKDSKHSFQRFGLTGVNAPHQCVWAVSEQDFRVRLVRLIDISRVKGLSGYLAKGIDTLR